MKIHEVSKLTGLTQKTIRFYEKRELFTPQYEIKNGRAFRCYTEEDVKTLSMIADLRRALFSVEEIKVMIESPGTIPSILKAHADKINSRYKEIEALRDALDAIALDEVSNVYKLSEALSPGVKEMSLPKIDVMPRFKYIDAQEKMPLKKKRLRGFALIHLMPHTKATEVLIDNNKMYLE